MQDQSQKQRQVLQHVLIFSAKKLRLSRVFICLRFYNQKKSAVLQSLPRPEATKVSWRYRPETVALAIFVRDRNETGR